jgi:hypothetical protein
MEEAKKFFDAHPLEGDPKVGMKVAAAAAKVFEGSSTFSVMVLQDNKLTAANLGDSGFIVLRRDVETPVRACHRRRGEPGACLACERVNVPGAGGGGSSSSSSSTDSGWKVVFKSQEQQFKFNHPLQIGRSTLHKAEDAINVSIPVRAGDVVVIGTDGLFDNLFVNDVMQIVTRTFEENPAPVQCNDNGYASHIAQVLATSLADAAFHASTNPGRRGPFAAACARAGYRFDGGKMDDICVVTAWLACDEGSGDDRGTTTSTTATTTTATTTNT